MKDLAVLESALKSLYLRMSFKNFILNYDYYQLAFLICMLLVVIIE